MPEPYVSIPETITVHLGAPSSNAQNITVPFADYIKNVASSEIYPTWPEQAIRANVYAQMSYVLNRVFTEWYRAQGYDFDITNSTRYDQSFVPGRDIFENISTIVDDMIGTYLTRGDSIEPLFTQYCNGTTVTCPGGLSQWGTVPLAEQGLSAEQILQSFYGNDINFVTGAPLSPNLGGSFPGVTLRLGDFSEDVRTVQTRLNRISTNFPNIPKIYPTDGVFNADTERAVRAFQRQFNLTEDGLVGPATWYRIAFIYNNVKRLSELNSEGLTLSEISRQYPERLTEGMSGPGVQLCSICLPSSASFMTLCRAGRRDRSTVFSVRRPAKPWLRISGLSACPSPVWWIERRGIPCFPPTSPCCSPSLSRSGSKNLSACRKPFLSRACAAKPCGRRSSSSTSSRAAMPRCPLSR